MKRLLAVFIALLLLMPCGITQVYADIIINNQIKNEQDNTVITGTAVDHKSGIELLLSTGDQNTIAMPSIYSYIQPTDLYVDALGNHSIYVYKELNCDKKKLMPFAYEGMRVTAIAEQKYGDTAMTCIVYRDENYRLHAGWVHSKYLTIWFPGAVETMGNAYLGTVCTNPDPALSWGRDYFVNTRHKYTVLSQPVRSCTRFLLNYQVTGRGGARFDELLGPRTVYVNDGSGWIVVGQFEYDKIQSVLVTINLPEPKDLLAVAVIPYCSKPDSFTFRQTVQDVLTAATDVVQGGNNEGQEAGSAVIIWENEPGKHGADTDLAANMIKKRSIVTFGRYEQDIHSMGSREPIEWIVLDIQDDKLLLISLYALDCLSYCSRQKSVAWETSRIRGWLNDQFLNAAFTDEEQEFIIITDVDNGKNQGYIHYEGDGGSDTQDQIFLLSYCEAWRYFYQNNDRACKPTKVAVKRGAYESTISGNCPWWLRSPGYTTDYVAGVDVDGNRGGNVKYGAMAVRPAMWVDYNAVRYFGTYNNK